MKKFFHTIVKHKWKSILLALSIGIPFFIASRSVYLGGIPFWFDPARDFLLALDNIKKPTLIGPPSGVPGIFYGPYWIWAISIGMLFSKDPRVIVFFILTLPYFVIFPYVLFSFRKLFGFWVCLLLWILFIFSYMNYSTYLWNPHIASLLLLAQCLLVTRVPVLKKFSRKTFIMFFFIGILNGLLINHHIPLGLGIFTGTSVFLMVYFLISMRSVGLTRTKLLNSLAAIGLFFSGFFVTLLPFLVFEFRHNFLQLRVLGQALYLLVFHNTSLITLKGFASSDIYAAFFGIMGDLLTIPRTVGHWVLIVLSIVAIIRVYSIFSRKESSYRQELMLFGYLVSCGTVILSLYLISRNPVWQYHFNGIDILFLLFVGIVTAQSRIVRVLLSIWIVVFVFIHIQKFIANYSINPYVLSSIHTKRAIVEKIYRDAGSEPFSVSAYSSGIYTFDYDYLFLWLGQDIYKKNPIKERERSIYTYLIIPTTSDDVRLDFIHYKTPDMQFRTVNEWKIDDGTLIIKRENQKRQL